MLHGGQIKKGRSKPLATSVPVKRSNDKKSPHQDINPMKKYNMDINIDTCATNTIQEQYSMHNLKQDMK